MSKGTKSRPRLIVAYGGVVLLLVVFAFLVWLRGNLPSGVLDDVEWMLVLALLVATPLLLEYVRPMLKGIKVAGLIEADFHEARTSSATLEDVVEALRYEGIDKQKAVDWAGNMTSLSNVIVDKVRELSEKRVEILPVDLRTGNAWIFPNLFFLALLSAHRTNVRQFVFLETIDERDNIYIGLCSPRNLLGRVGMALPYLVELKNAIDYRYGGLDVDQQGHPFFGALAERIRQEEDIEAEKYKQWVTSESLRPVLGSALSRNMIAWKGWLTRDDCRYVLSSPYRYVGAVAGDQYLFTIDQQKLSLAVARNIARETTG